MAEEIFKHKKSPYWYYKIPLLDSNGHVIDYERKSTKQRDKGKARLVARNRAKILLEKRELGLKDDPSISQVVADFIEVTRNEEQKDLKNQLTFQRQLFGDDTSKSRLISPQMPISELNRTVMMRIKARHSKGRKVSTVNNMMTFLISIYNYADELGYDVPSDQKDFESLKGKTDQKTRYLLKGEETKFLAEIDPKREAKGMQPYEDRIGTLMQTKLQDQYDISISLMDTGVRYTEGTTVPWDCVDTDDWVGLNPYRDKVGKEGFIEFTPRLREIYQRRYRQHGNSPYVFPSPVDNSRPRGYSVKGISKAIDRAGLNEDHLVKRFGKFTPHCFRHSFASRLAQAGMSLQAISLLLGHSDTKMTQRYAHLVKSDESRKAAEILGRGYE